MNLVSRTFRHLLTTSGRVHRLFPAPALKAIQTAIASGEKQHRAEIRVLIEAALPLHAVVAGLSPRQRARELFALYRIWDTEENCGILVYIDLADRKIEIIADRTAGRLLPQHDWQAVCNTITSGFAQGSFHDSLLAGLHQLNGLLAAQFPADGGHPNQLPNRPLIL